MGSGQLCTTMAVSTLPEAPDFDTWLTFKLKSLDTDETVFGSYIKGILEGEESQDEKIEAIEGLLAEIAPSDDATQKDVCKEILDKWESFVSAASEVKSEASVSVDLQIARIMEQQALCVVPTRKSSEESKKLKQSILTLYATVSDEEEEDDNDYETGGYDSGDDSRLMKNTNAEKVMEVEKMKKDALRVESQKKKEKDREDREKQKQSQQDRKEKEKKRTMKGEKRQ